MEAWGHFVQYACERRPRFGVLLQMTKALESRRGEITVGAVRGSFVCEQLKDNLADINQLAREFFGDGTRLYVVGLADTRRKEAL